MIVSDDKNTVDKNQENFDIFKISEVKRYEVFHAFHNIVVLLQFSGICALLHVLRILPQKKVVAGLGELVTGNQGLLGLGPSTQHEKSGFNWKI